MKFKDWTINDLIEYLESSKHAPKDVLDYRHVTRISGEIHAYNGEKKD